MYTCVFTIHVGTIYILTFSNTEREQKHVIVRGEHAQCHPNSSHGETDKTCLSTTK